MNDTQIHNKVMLETSKKMLRRWEKELEQKRIIFELDERNLLALIKNEEENVQRYS